MSTPKTAAAAYYNQEESVRALETAYLSRELVQQRQATLELLGLKPGEAVLDVGCGPGQLTTAMAAEVGKAGRVCGVDVSAAMVARAKARAEVVLPSEGSHAAPEFAVGAADTDSLPFADASFDAVVMVQVLCYVPDASRALIEMARVLRPDGRILILDSDRQTLVLASDDRERSAMRVIERPVVRAAACSAQAAVCARSSCEQCRGSSPPSKRRRATRTFTSLESYRHSLAPRVWPCAATKG